MFKKSIVVCMCSAMLFAATFGSACGDNNNNNNQEKTTNNDGGTSDGTTVTDDGSTGSYNRTKDSKFTESKTSTEFKGLMDVAGQNDPFFLMGMGVRVKIIINVYAFGLYVEPLAAQKELAAWKGKAKSELEKDDTFYDKLLKGKFSKMMRLKMTFDASADDMAQAFDDSISSRIDKLIPEGERQAAKDALTKFKGFFDSPAKQGQELLFIWQEDGKLVTIVDGTNKGTIDNAGLALCLFDIYIGKEPINEDGKKDFASGMSDLLP